MCRSGNVNRDVVRKIAGYPRQKRGRHCGAILLIEHAQPIGRALVPSTSLLRLIGLLVGTECSAQSTCSTCGATDGTTCKISLFSGQGSPPDN